MPEVAFGPYTLIKRIAVGGMAEVYLARTGTGPAERQVVVKQILPQLAEEPELLQLFFDEARIASRVVHPGIVRVLDVGKHDGVHFLAMEFVDGLDLSQLLRIYRDHSDKPFPLPVALRIAIDLARALHSVHEAREPDGSPLDIVHRDVSPQNVLISKRGDVKLGDFGIARARIRAKKTQTGVLRGKIAYVSPEQYHGHRGDRRVDVYAIGIVLFELIAGRRPFGGDEATMIRDIMTTDAPSLASLVPGLDVRVSSIVALALARRPEDRIPSAKAFADALEALAMARPQVALADLVVSCLALRERAREAQEGASPRPTQTLPGPSEVRPAGSATETLASGVGQEELSTRILEDRAGHRSGGHAIRARAIEPAEAGVAAALALAETLPMPALLEPDRGPLPEPETVAVTSPAAPQPPLHATAVSAVLAAPRTLFFLIVAVALVGGYLISTRGPVAPRRVHRLEAIVVPSSTVGHAVLEGGGDTATAAPPAELPTIAPLARAEAHEVGEDERPGIEAIPRRVKKRPRPKRPRPEEAAPRREQAPAEAAGPIAVAQPVPEGGSTPAKPAARVAPAAEAFGALSLDSEPWSYVHVGKLDLGVTPLANVRLPAGRHKVRLENPERKLSRSITLTIRADEDLAVRVRLEDGRIDRR